MSPFIIGFLVQMLVNPQNAEATILVYEDSKLVKYFTADIAERLPTYF